jgi:AraC family transcriptional regulator of adaptative response/methylated-DNA-[protein]-cysteine methyltransferase
MATMLRERPRTTAAPRQQEEIRFSYRPSSLGLILIAASNLGVRAVMLGDDHETLRQDLAKRYPDARLVNGDAKLVTRVVEAVEHPEQPNDVPIDMDGTAFQKSVWQALRQVPAGQTVSYGELARRIGHPAAVRAVAHACATNPLAVLVPCHRAVRSNGALAGYRWGLARKRELLEREGVRRGA